MRNLPTDVLIVGGGTGGVAAAMACAERGVRCVITEPTDWIGGQLTSQAVPPDENEWVETVGGSRRYREFRERVRRWYRVHRTLRPSHAQDPHLNPGGGWVSRLCMEPAVAHEVLCDMLAPHVASGLVRILLRTRPTAVQSSGDRLDGVALEHLDSCELTTVTAACYLDATDLGDLYDLGKVEHTFGAESKATYGEMHGRDDHDDPSDQQAFSWCFAMSHEPDGNHVIDRPPSYSQWRDYVPQMTPPWCGPLFSWTIPTHNKAGCRELNLVPPPDAPPSDSWELWRYRSIVDASIYEPGSAHPPDVCLVNWVQMDFWKLPLLGVSGEKAMLALHGAKELSRCLLYWMQTQAPRHDGGTGYPGLRLRGDELGTSDGFAKAPYIREPRRLLARTMLHEGHIGTEQRRAEGRARMDRHPLGLAEPFADSIAIGHYTLDLHPSTAGRNSVYVPAAPFRIPLGSLIPQRVTNVIGAGKAIGVTHIANGCTRMHTVEWSVGEAAGALAAWCVTHGTGPHAVHESAESTRAFQQEIVSDGMPISWPWEA